MPKISIIIPCYYNEKNIPVTAGELIENERNFSGDVTFEYVMVDDGSKDNTLRELENFRNQYQDRVKIVKLAGNFGSYNAIVAGMEYATGDCNVVIAADLQDPPELMAKMFDYWLSGFKLVIGNRQAREESLGTRIFANTLHYLMKRWAIKNIPSGGFDYVLFDKDLRREVLRMNEKNTNVLYLLIWMGYEYVNIPYTRRQRKIGKSRWTFKKKIKLFIDSFVSFSFFPIRAISTGGLLLGFIALLYAIYIFIAKITNLIPIEGWTSLMIVILFVSSFQMIGLGIIGEYVWRGFDAARKRPSYIIDKVYGDAEA
jgi:dolichol-phosphate mannosyltransferase